VDDLVAVLPRLGNRPEHACEAYDWVARAFFGERAINEEKNAIEGIPSLQLKVWGYDMDLRGVAKEGACAAVVSIPEVKQQKLRGLLTVEFLEKVGKRQVTLKEMQKIQDECVEINRVGGSDRE
jgi:hypothetical protein